MPDKIQPLNNLTQHSKLLIRVSSNESGMLPTEIYQQLLKPHRKANYFFIFIIKGQSKHSVDLEEIKLKAGQLLLFYHTKFICFPKGKKKLSISN